MSGLDWRGEQILAAVAEASRLAIDETTEACVPIGKRLVRKKTRTLMGRIDNVPAEIHGDEVIGGYGVPDDPGYALEQEFLPDDNTPAVDEEGHTARRLPAGRAYIRPAADEEYPKLKGRVARHFAERGRG